MRPLPLLFDTWRALLAPRRLLPVALVCGAMVLAQGWFSGTFFSALLGLAMCLGFLAIGPFAWRLLFPLGSEPSVLRILLFACAVGVPALFGWVLTDLQFVPQTFLTVGVNALVILTLSWAGAWGLARDIDMERGLHAERARATALARQAEQARLMALKAHLDPHFLFNTLNAIAEWCREDGAVAEQAVLQLSALLREVMAGTRAEGWPLRREIELVRDLWDLHRIRDPQRFTASFRLPEPLPETDVPPMILLPLAENAIKHGPAAGHRGEVSLTVEASDREVRLLVCNPGPFAGPRQGGEGLELVRQRLAQAYDGAAAFTIGGEDGRTIARVVLPRSA